MKVAIVTETFYPSTDGVVTRLTAAVRWLIKEGHEVIVIAPDQGISSYEGATVHGIPAFRFFLYKHLPLSYPRPLVGKLLRRFAPDVVHVVNPAVLGVAGIWYGRRWPLVASYHTHVPHYADFYRLTWLKPILWWYVRLMHNRADLNLCTSHAVMEELKARRFRNVKVWKRGVNTELFGPRHRNADMRHRLSGGEPDKKVLLYVGRLAAEKQIESVRSVLDASDAYRFAVVGDGPHREALEEHFRGTRTTFHGFLHGDELAAAYASSDLFVFPSTTETLGLVLLEAMASGLPVVAAASGPTLEQIDDGHNGFLFDPLREGEFARKVLSLTDEAELRRAGERAFRAAAELGWDGPSRQLLDVYRTALRVRTVRAARTGAARAGKNDV